MGSPPGTLETPASLITAADATRTFLPAAWMALGTTTQTQRNTMALATTAAPLLVGARQLMGLMLIRPIDPVSDAQ